MIKHVNMPFGYVDKDRDMSDSIFKAVTHGWKKIPFLIGKLVENNPRENKKTMSHGELIGHSGWRDHASMWSDKEKNVYMITHPYHLYESDIVEMSEFCKERGLLYQISGASWHYPGATCIVVIHKDGIVSR